MTVATSIETVQQWLNQTDGLRLVQATSNEGKPITSNEILALAERCEWVETDDISDTPYAKDGYLYPISLELGWGNPDDAYTTSNNAKVLFFNAYYQKAS
ncbi:hypothetical protein BMF77_03072 [Dolichospermum sp. UHCC 0315A]|uniref:hypothetical protein n=1 Tax=Dolichospermum sp. UHCC 0315A TaxID=1914871 RepID=UPI0011E7904E|nr:hypothetical protein [Dolichospermum sp. UHCC 0315A]MBO1052142.1 hypothetical protein [Dolichospermum sp. DET73]QEI42463.1 hypothetical protein BMF77_03072 [Dolichospermum sp. UHCC 0315A]